MSTAMAPHQVLTLMVVGFCIFMQVQGARCPLGFVRHKRSCYWFSITKGSFSEARDKIWKMQRLPQSSLHIWDCLSSLMFNEHVLHFDDISFCWYMIGHHAQNVDMSNTGVDSSMCRFLRSDLAKVTSKDEDDFIRHFALVRGRGRKYFLGGSDLRQTRRWSWNGEEQRMTFTNWAPGEPNSHLTQRCLILWDSSHYQWADYHCHAVINYVCERPVL